MYTAEYNRLRVSQAKWHWWTTVILVCMGMITGEMLNTEDPFSTLKGGDLEPKSLKGQRWSVEDRILVSLVWGMVENRFPTKS